LPRRFEQKIAKAAKKEKVERIWLNSFTTITSALWKAIAQSPSMQLARQARRLLTSERTWFFLRVTPAASSAPRVRVEFEFEAAATRGGLRNV